jgi:hypothetical protein
MGSAVYRDNRDLAARAAKGARRWNRIGIGPIPPLRHWWYENGSGMERSTGKFGNRSDLWGASWLHKRHGRAIFV